MLRLRCAAQLFGGEAVNEFLGRVLAALFVVNLVILIARAWFRDFGCQFWFQAAVCGWLVLLAAARVA